MEPPVLPTDSMDSNYVSAHENGPLESHGIDIVYGKHNFVPEEVDEIDFKIGEPIAVLEKDEEYDDGWWRGQNIRGRIGLFPQNFTTFDNILQVDIESMVYSVFGHLLEKKQEEAASVVLEPSESHYVTNDEDLHDPTTVSVDESFVDADMTLPSVIEPPAEEAHLVQESMKNPELWNQEEIQEWLIKTGFEHVAHLFTDMTTGSEFMQLNLSHLRMMGISELSDRINILHEILVLKDQYKKYVTDLMPVCPIDETTENKMVDLALEDKLDSGYVESMKHISLSEVKAQRLKHSKSEFTLSDYLYGQRQSDATQLGTLSRPSEPSDDEKPLAAFISCHPAEMNDDSQSDQSPTDFVIEDSDPINKKKGLFSLPKKDTLSRANKTLAKSMAKLARKITAKTKSDGIPSIPEVDELEHEKLNLEQAEFSGWLSIRIGKQERLWKRRFCALLAGVLYILKDHQGGRIMAMIPLTTHSYEILPAPGEHFKNKFTFKAECPQDTTRPVIYFGAETQLSMVSWINMLVRVVQNAIRTGPMQLIPIKTSKQDLSRPVDLMIDLSEHSLPVLESGLPTASTSTPLSSAPSSPQRVFADSLERAHRHWGGSNDHLRRPSRINEQLVRRPTWAATAMPPAKYYPPRTSLDDLPFRNNRSSWNNHYEEELKLHPLMVEKLQRKQTAVQVAEGQDYQTAHEASRLSRLSSQSSLRRHSLDSSISRQPTWSHEMQQVGVATLE